MMARRKISTAKNRSLNPLQLKEVHDMIISLLGTGSETLLSELDSAGVEYIQDYPPSGDRIKNAPNTIQIIKDISGVIPWGTIAAVLIAWLKYRSSRKIQVKLKNGKISHLETNGLPPEKFKELLPYCQKIIAVETKKLEKSK